jgi:hypothetical protein
MNAIFYGNRVQPRSEFKLQFAVFDKRSAAKTSTSNLFSVEAATSLALVSADKLKFEL